jgi:leucine-rich repeat protein SHOC2
VNLVDICIMKKDGLDKTIEKAKLMNLSALDLKYCDFYSMSNNIGDLINLKELDIGNHKLLELPESIGNLTNLKILKVNSNNIGKLPKSIKNLSNLINLNLNDNPLDDLSILQRLPNLKIVHFLDVYLPRQYWIKFSDWKSEWLLVEDNAEIRRTLIEHVGYEKICDELNAIEIDTWREYALLKIDNLERFYRFKSSSWSYEEREDREPELHIESMVFLKMTCPSTRHVHILRVPPDTTSAEAAITWVNHGIHPVKIAVAT